MKVLDPWAVCKVAISSWMSMLANMTGRQKASLVEALDLDEEGPAVFYRVGHGSQGTHSDVKSDNRDPGAEENSYFQLTPVSKVRDWQSDHHVLRFDVLPPKGREYRESEITVVGRQQVASFSILTGLNFVQGSISLYRVHMLLSHEQFHPIGKIILSGPNWSNVSVVLASHSLL